MEFVRDHNTVTHVRIFPGRASPSLFVSYTSLDVSVALQTEMAAKPRRVAEIGQTFHRSPNLKAQRAALDGYIGADRPDRDTDLVRDLDVLLDQLLDGRNDHWRDIGCEDPKIVVRLADNFMSVASARRWRAAPENGKVMFDGCGRCPMCLAKRTVVLGGLAKAAFWNEPRAVALCRTFADDDIARSWGLALHLDADRRRYMRQVVKRAFPDRDIQWLSSHEIGSAHGRRHFHDMIIGITEAEFLQLFDAEWFVVYGLDDRGGMYKIDAWPFGHVHVAPVQDYAQAFYVGKYASKALAMACAVDDASRAQAARLRALGEPVLDKYVAFPRPAIGRHAIRRLVEDQFDRLYEERKLAGRGILRGNKGLVLPEKDGNPERGLPLRRDDRVFAVGVLRELAQGRSLSVPVDGTWFTGHIRDTSADVWREALLLKESEVIV